MIMGGSKNYKVLKKGMGSTGADLNSSLFHGSGTKNIISTKNNSSLRYDDQLILQNLLILHTIARLAWIRRHTGLTCAE
jgi:hypothetical protein